MKLPVHIMLRTLKKYALAISKGYYEDNLFVKYTDSIIMSATEKPMRKLITLSSGQAFTGVR